MSGKSSKKRLRRNSPRETDSENGSETQQVTESSSLNEKDFDDITNRIENKFSKRLKDTELGQREILKLIEKLSSKVDSVGSSSSESCSSNRSINSREDPPMRNTPEIESVQEEITQVN